MRPCNFILCALTEGNKSCWCFTVISAENCIALYALVCFWSLSENVAKGTLFSMSLGWVFCKNVQGLFDV